MHGAIQYFAEYGFAVMCADGDEIRAWPAVIISLHAVAFAVVHVGIKWHPQSSTHLCVVIMGRFRISPSEFPDMLHVGAIHESPLWIAHYIRAIGAQNIRAIRESPGCRHSAPNRAQKNPAEAGSFVVLCEAAAISTAAWAVEAYPEVNAAPASWAF